MTLVLLGTVTGPEGGGKPQTDSQESNNAECRACDLVRIGHRTYTNIFKQI